MIKEMNLRLRPSAASQDAEHSVDGRKVKDEDCNGVNSKFPPISPLNKSRRSKNIIHRIRFSKGHSDVRPLSPCSVYSSTNRVTSNGSMIKSVKRALKPRKKRVDEESKGLLLDGEHEVAPMLMHSFGTLDFSNKEVEDDILVDVDEAIAGQCGSMSPLSVDRSTEEDKSPKRRWKKISISPSKKRPPSPKPAKPPLSTPPIRPKPPKDGFCRQVDSYDGQIILVDNKPAYELGNYLGGGVAGVVYEGTRLSYKTQPKRTLSEHDTAIEVPTVNYIADIPMVDSVDAPSRSKYHTEETVAVKILNPIGFRLVPANIVQSALVLKQGVILSPEIKYQSAPLQPKHVWWLINPNSRNLRTLMLKTPSDVDRGKPDRGVRLSLIAAYQDDNQLKELPLHKCIEIWGHAPFGATEEEFEDMMDVIERVNSGMDVEDSEHQSFHNTGLGKAASSGRNVVFNTTLNAYVAIPAVPPKFLRWLRQRRAATKEIRNMMHIGRHKNVVHLYEVLELIQDSKSTMFLILELVKGGELFDLISSTSTSAKKLNKADAEPIMRKYFYELASGIAYCHSNGIAHRDLKPENLLVHQDGENCTLKIADFGLSATFAVMNQQSSVSSVEDTIVPISAPVTGLSPLFKNMNSISQTALHFLSCGTHSTHCALPCPDTTITYKQEPLRRMTSIVGSPHYVAPEIVLQAEKKTTGYDGTKADVWSAGVILYAMLYRSLPFGEDLLRCPRYQSFTRWYDDAKKIQGSRRSSQALTLNSDFDGKCLGPHWFFPVDTSWESQDLIMAMLNPDPCMRLSIEQCLLHPWLRNYDS